MNPTTLDHAACRRPIADRVFRAIKHSGLTQKEIAARMEISEQYLSDIVKDRRSVSAFVAVRLESVLGLDARKIMIDQALDELNAARVEYRAEVQL